MCMHLPFAHGQADATKTKTDSSQKHFKPTAHSTRACLQGTKQKEFGVSATQLQAGISPWQSIQAAAVAIATECYCYDTPVPCDSALNFFQGALAGDVVKQHTLWLVLGTCFLALAVNLCSFGLIGRTSPITFQVVGHMKTCLVLAGGYAMFPPKVPHRSNQAQGVVTLARTVPRHVLRRHTLILSARISSMQDGNTQQLMNNIMGVSVAMVGVILYGHLKHASGNDQPDCMDAICPSCVLSTMEPSYGEDEETQGLKSEPR